MESRRLSFIYAELHYRHVRTWEYMTQHGPCSMIETPTKVKADEYWRQQTLYSLRQIGITWSRILHFIKLTWKTSEIMNRAWGRHCRYGSTWQIPMSRNRQHGFWARNCLSNTCPAAGVIVPLQSI